MAKKLVESLKNIREYQVYHNGKEFRIYRVAPESIVDIIKRLAQVWGGEFEAVNKANNTKIIYVCK